MWGSIPDWLAVVTAWTLAVLGFFKRNKVALWFNKKIFRPTPVERASISISDEGLRPSNVSQDVVLGAIKVTNFGPGTAWNLKLYPEDEAQLEGQSNWPQFEVGQEVVLEVVSGGDSPRLGLTARWQDENGVAVEQFFAIRKPKPQPFF